MSKTTKIRRHTNGSIDIGHYRKNGRSLHGRAMREAANSLIAKFQELWVAMTMRLRQSPISPLSSGPFLQVAAAE